MIQIWDVINVDNADILGRRMVKENIIISIPFILVVIVNVWQKKVGQDVVEMMTMVDMHLQIPIAIRGMDGY